MMKLNPVARRLAILFRVSLVSLAFLLSSPVALPAQAPAPIAPLATQATDGAKPKAAPHKKSLWETLKQGGIVMPFIGLCSVFVFYLVMDAFMRTSKNRLCPKREVEKARKLFMAGDYVAAYQVMKANPSSFNNCVKYALAFVGKGKEQAEEAMMVEMGRENARLQNRINYLSVIGVCSPMIGLLGTVIGMMGAFTALGQSGAADTAKLSEHIGEVLVATASGLFIAIPAFMFFYILRNRLSIKMHDLEDQVVSLFRNMPYEHFRGLEIGEEVTYAAVPNWVDETVVAATPVEATGPVQATAVAPAS